jgi:hypothetical protein
MSEWVKCADRLPEDDQLVWIWLKEWVSHIHDDDGPMRLFAAVFRRGATIEERPHGPWRFFDQWGNNPTPYAWEDPDSGNWYGPDPSHWMERALPEPPPREEWIQTADQPETDFGRAYRAQMEAAIKNLPFPKLPQ